MRFDPWVAGIVGAFVTLIGVYTVFIYVAVSGAPQIEASYIETER
ncbi:MAG: hypothetical protein ACI8S6_000142 [Myxococcota bacterium]|jgi:hypothetical protein